MTAPTPAQIEAAAKVIDSFGFLAIDSTAAAECAKAALAAAAEASSCGCMYPQDCAEKITAAYMKGRSDALQEVKTMSKEIVNE